MNKTSKSTQIFGENYAHFSKKRYRIHHDYLQKRVDYFSLDKVYIVESTGKFAEVGINKDYDLLDSHYHIDEGKDINE